jgi:hypothetical protein
VAYERVKPTYKAYFVGVRLLVRYVSVNVVYRTLGTVNTSDVGHRTLKFFVIIQSFKYLLEVIFCLLCQLYYYHSQANRPKHVAHIYKLN